MPNLQLLAAAIDGRLQNVSTLDPSSQAADSIRFLFLLLVAVAAFILAIVWGVLFYSLIRFRRRQKTAAESKPDNEADIEPPQVYGSMPIELAWTVAPGLIVFLLILVIVRIELEVRVPIDRAPMGAEISQVNVVGHQWWWEYRIQQSDREPTIITANELHIPGSDASGDKARRTYLLLDSADVCHSYWIPRLAGKTDLIPGHPNQMWLQTAETGVYLGQCAEYCGAQHAGMLLRVQVDAPDEYAAWLANESKAAVNEPSVKKGREAFLLQSCRNCHTIRGTTAAGTVGPDLTHLASRQTLGAGIADLSRANLRRWIKDPQALKAGCLMPAFGLSDEQINWITDYLMSLK